MESSLPATVIFAERFLAWCASAGYRGEIDWPRLCALACEFAEFDGLRLPTEMALSKALSSFNLPKSTRLVTDDETGVVSAKRSTAKRKRVTTYSLPNKRESSLVTATSAQLELFSRS